MAPGEQRDAGVDDIRRPSNAAKRTRCARLIQIEVPHVEQAGLQQPGQPYLPRAVSPGLPDHSCRHVNRRATLGREFNQATYTPVVTLKRDQRTGIEHYSPRA
jgi:hypothetical protein